MAGRTTKCVKCGRRVSTRRRESIHRAGEDGKFRCVCLPCANTELAEALEISYTPAVLPEITLHDRDEEPHSFVFVERLSPAGKVVEAFEKDVEEGYEAQALSEDHEANAVALRHAVVRKLARALGRRELEQGDQLPLQAPVRGRISWDREAHAPLVVIGGRPFTWEQFGRMFSTYEGFHFLLEMFDRSDER